MVRASPVRFVIVSLVLFVRPVEMLYSCSSEKYFLSWRLETSESFLSIGNFAVVGVSQFSALGLQFFVGVMLLSDNHERRS